MQPTITITPSVLYFGSQVLLLSTLMPDGATNITPISSGWALGDSYVLGLGLNGQAARNLALHDRLVINIPDASQVDAVERIAPTTGAREVPAAKRARFRHEPDKWTLGGFTPRASELVRPVRIAECPVQMEAAVTRTTPVGVDGEAVAVEVRVLRTHAHAAIVEQGTSHIDLRAWRPMYYTFRHYIAQGEEVGVSFRAEQ
ncbi:flavin reductase family protein [Mycetocola reblochoni]|uniref:Flavin reductase like domain-containing protein n=2 Tax=Mycetocola reblochoni TaxID=331618 RepID=A0A1R4K8W1_9MICO|nr:flavin reductase [Mycetocola reblochoni]RLP68156.1 flavin reductase family protein [Mycetocola reblochoni]SJN40747.1 unknown [Mycetocola reblochoni REB411]